MNETILNTLLKEYIDRLSVYLPNGAHKEFVSISEKLIEETFFAGRLSALKSVGACDELKYPEPEVMVK